MPQTAPQYRIAAEDALTAAEGQLPNIGQKYPSLACANATIAANMAYAYEVQSRIDATGTYSRTPKTAAQYRAKMESAQASALDVMDNWGQKYPDIATSWITLAHVWAYLYEVQSKLDAAAA